jgi:hypothetical protein
MANLIYDKGKEEILNGNIDFVNDTIKIALVDTGTYTVDAATHEDYADLSGVVGTDATLGSVTVTDGDIDCADITWSSVSGSSVEALVVYKDTGTPATSTLLFYLDTNITGLPVTPSGGDIILAVNASGLISPMG